MAIGQAIQGGIGGALGGGGIGGPVGAAIGGGLGLLGGLFGGDPSAQYRDQLMQLEKEFANRRFQGAGAASQSANSGFRGNQQQLVSMLEAMARGQGPSVAGQQIKTGADRLVGGQNAMAAGAAGRGVNAGAAFRQASNAGAAIGAQGNQDAGMARIQEQMGAVNQLGMTLHGARDQDESNSRFNAGQNNQVMLANLDAQLRAQGMSDQMRLQILTSAMAGAGPGMGTQLLAGGASMFPYLSGQNAAGGGQGGGGQQFGAGQWHGAPQMWQPQGQEPLMNGPAQTPGQPGW